MATRLKTVSYAFPVLASLANNTDTNLTQITIYLPETGTKTFRSVVAKVSMDDIVTATGGTLTTKNFDLQLGAAGYTAIDNANTLTNSGENLSLHYALDYTSHFTTNWTGTSMTCDFRLQINQSTGTTLGMVNVCVTLDITYEYDDTSTTQVKTVMLPLDAPVSTLATSVTTYDTIPEIAYYCPEATKTFRAAYVVLQGNEGNNGGTTDFTITLAVGASTETTGNHESALGSDRFTRYVYNLLADGWSSFTSTQNFQLSSTTARLNHPQAWLVLTYEFAVTSPTTLTEDLDNSETGVDVASAAALGTAPYVICVENEQMLVTSVASNTLTVTRGYNGTSAATHANGAAVTPCVLNSVQLPMGVASPLGITTSSDYQRAYLKDFLIPEPGPIASKRIAFFPFWVSSGAITGLNFRIGTGSFVAYTDVANLQCGNNAAMIRNDAAFTLARGLNTLNFDAYSADTTDYGGQLCGFWLLNYVSALSSQGIGAHSHTVRHTCGVQGTVDRVPFTTYGASAPSIPESNYYLSHLAYECLWTSGTVAYTFAQVQMERLSGEGGIAWEDFQALIGDTDVELGCYYSFSHDVQSLFKKYTGDPRSNVLDIESSRRWRTRHTASVFSSVELIYTYHSISFTVAGNITGSAGGTVNIKAHDALTGNKLVETSRSGNGSYSMTWYENSRQLYVEAYENSTHLGRSANTVASGTN